MSLKPFSNPITQYVIVTCSYWAFTLTDGALRILVVLFFHNLGFEPLQVAMLFLLYELFGVGTNLFGGWLASRIGLNVTMHLGMALQIVSLAMLLVDAQLLSVAYVMVTQALSGIAKDLNKMSAKSSIKGLVVGGTGTRLYSWIARLTGSKNALKGVGFFLGGTLLSLFGFRGAILSLAIFLGLVLLISVWLLDRKLGMARFKPRFQDIFSKTDAINRLSAARFFLFSSRDVWFVVALPVFLQSQLYWSASAVGSLLAIWVILYGFVQAIAPMITGASPTSKTAFKLAVMLCSSATLLAVGLLSGWQGGPLLVIGLLIFGVIFAINSSVHSYLIVSWARNDGVSLDVGFYYMANAAGRLFGTLMSGLIYQWLGLAACLVVSTVLVAISAGAVRRIPVTDH